MIKENLKHSLGFTLIELLIASTIFASVLGVVYGLFNEAVISKKNLDSTLRINELVKNADQVIQTAMREANGEFFKETKLWQVEAPSSFSVRAFFVAPFYKNPNEASTFDEVKNFFSSFSGEIVFEGGNAVGRGDFLYINDSEKKKVYIFGLGGIIPAMVGAYPSFYAETWKYNDTNNRWEREGERVILFSFDNQAPAFFEIPLTKEKIGDTEAYRENTSIGGPPSYNSWVRLRVNAIQKFGKKLLVREFNQVYVPLILSNPYL